MPLPLPSPHVDCLKVKRKFLSLIVASHDYFPFGFEATATNQDTERLKWAGYERDLQGTTDQVDDLDYLHARFENFNIGRFLSVDPVRGNPKRPQSFNLFAYARNNPLNLKDPLGLSPQEATASGIVTNTDGTTRPCTEEDKAAGIPSCQVDPQANKNEGDDENDQQFHLFDDVDIVDVLQPVGDFSAGFGDTLTLGLTKAIREQTPGASEVDLYSGSYTAGMFAGLAEYGALGGAWALRPLTASTQLVTSWAPAGITPVIKAGTWAMTGGQTIRNWIMSGVFLRYPYANSASQTVSGGASGTVGYPPGVLGWIKGLLGQRIFWD